MTKMTKLVALVGAGTALAALLALGQVQAAPVKKAPPPSQCHADETVVFGCRVGVKLASVCSTVDHVIYRFGPKGAPEVEIASTGKDGVAYKSFGVGGGGGSFNNIRFKHDGYNYVVSTMAAGNLTDIPGKSSSTLTVMKDDKAVSRHDCPAVSAQDKLADVSLPDDPDERFVAWY